MNFLEICMSSVQCKRTDTSNSIISCFMESFLADLKKDVQCSLCNDTLVEPKILPCFHTFCKLCIKRHAKLIEQVNVFKCPECKTETSLPELSSVEDLKPSLLHSRIVKVLEFAESQKVCSVCDTHCPVALWYCFDCNNSICEACFKFHSVFTKDHKIIRFTDMNKEDHESLFKNQDKCKTHSKQMLDIYCDDCDKTICFVCLKLDHEEHKVMSLDKFTLINKDHLSEHLKTLEQLTVNKKEMKEQQEIAHKIQQDLKTAKTQVQDEARKLIKIVEENEEEMLRQIDEELDTATRNLNIIKHITAAKKYISNLIESGLASKRIRETDGYEDFIFSPFSKNSRITFVPNEELMLQTRSGIGKITSYYEPDHTMNTAQESQPEATRQDNLFGQVFPQVNGGVYMLPMPQGHHQRPFFEPPMVQLRPRWNMQQPQQQMHPGIPHMPTAGQVPRARGVRQVAPSGASPQAGIPQCTQGREQSTFNASLSSQQQNYISCESKTVMPNCKYSCSVSKKPQIVPGGLEEAREGINVPGHEPLLPSALAQAPLQEQKQMLGERLFSLIQTTYPELAGKITGMLLEIDNTELLNMLESRETLQAKVEEAVGVLKAYHAKDIKIDYKSTRHKKKK